MFYAIGRLLLHVTSATALIAGVMVCLMMVQVSIDVVACVIAFYLVLGMFLEPIGGMLVTLPIVLPIMKGAGYELLWFGIILAKVLEIGMITPPIGLNVFVIKGVVGDQISLATIFRGAVWFIVADLLVVGLAIAFPVLITYLPSLMR